MLSKPIVVRILERILALNSIVTWGILYLFVFNLFDKKMLADSLIKSKKMLLYHC